MFGAFSRVYRLDVRRFFEIGPSFTYNLIHSVRDGVSGVVDDGGQSGFPGQGRGGDGDRSVSDRGGISEGSVSHGSGEGAVGERSVSDRGGVGERSVSYRSGVGEGSVSHDGGGQRSGGGRGVSYGGDDSSLGSVEGQVSGSGGHDFGGVQHRGRSGSRSYGKGVAGYSVSGTVGDVVGSQNTTVGSDVAVGSDLVTESILKIKILI